MATTQVVRFHLGPSSTHPFIQHRTVAELKRKKIKIFKGFLNQTDSNIKERGFEEKIRKSLFGFSFLNTLNRNTNFYKGVGDAGKDRITF